MSKGASGQASFKQALPPIFLLGALLAIGFFASILVGPLNSGLLRRYCLNHPVAIACVSLFFVGLVTLAWKWASVFRQRLLTEQGSRALQKLGADGVDVGVNDRAAWLEANWKTLPRAIATSWLGRRIVAVLELQSSRGRRHQLESDLSNYSEHENDRQHESYSLLRIINWAMPMLGFLGTVLGISQTLGQLDTERLATQQQQAMNELTAGLYVAFDTTATALILTVALMFLQFAISRLETGLLGDIAEQTQKSLIPFLGVDPHDSQATLLAPVRELSEQVLIEIQRVTQAQADIWQQSLEASETRWTNWMKSQTLQADETIGHALGNALQEHVASLSALQEQSNAHFSSRMQQWQTTLSQQARAIHAQQQEVVSQCELMQSVLAAMENLQESVADLKKLEASIDAGVGNLENLGRLEETAACLVEGTAVLASGLERSGLLRGVPTKPRAAKQDNSKGRKAA
ncbi:MAG: MotA/TolQ/ExbB proton channel family protein [Planctomycetota bacterium]